MPESLYSNKHAHSIQTLDFAVTNTLSGWVDVGSCSRVSLSMELTAYTAGSNTGIGVGWEFSWDTVSFFTWETSAINLDVLGAIYTNVGGTEADALADVVAGTNMNGTTWTPPPAPFWRARSIALTASATLATVVFRVIARP